MLPLNIIFIIFLVITVIIQLIFFWIPVGNEHTTVRRMPVMTFSIITLNVVIFLASFMIVSNQQMQLQQRYTDIHEFLARNPALLADKETRDKLIAAHLATEKEFADYDKEQEQTRKFRGRVFNEDESAERDIDIFSEMHQAELRVELDSKISSYEKVRDTNLYYTLGIAPNGKWKAYQLLTHMFMHGGWVHLLGNMFFFFAIGFSLEDYWGRGLFLGFYIIGGLAACLPQLIWPESVPAIGASGAISAAMGAFLVRLPKTKIKIAWVLLLFLIPNIIRFLVSGRKFFGVANIPAFIFLPYYFMVQIASFWLEKKMGTTSGVAFSVHIAGFVFGALFALALKASKIEETYITPNIENKISFAAAPALTEAFEHLDRGELPMAERKLQAHLYRLPNDVEAMMVLVQVYQRSENYDAVNQTYTRVIRQHLAQGDKEAALYAYDGLLSSFPENAVNPKLPVRDWMMICEYLREIEMLEAASVEYERLAKTCPEDPLAIRAIIQGGETANLAKDYSRAMRLFEMARQMNPTEAYQIRIQAGINKCHGHLQPQPRPQSPQTKQQWEPNTKTV